jgi:hypothetical protein
MLSRGSFEPRVIGLWRFSLVGRSLSLDLALPRLDLSFHVRTAMACKGQPRLSSDHRCAGLSPKLNASFGHQICTTRNVLSMTRDDCARLRRKSFLSDEMGRRRCCPALAINAIALHIRLCRFFCKFSIIDLETPDARILGELQDGGSWSVESWCVAGRWPSEPQECYTGADRGHKSPAFSPLAHQPNHIQSSSWENLGRLRSSYDAGLTRAHGE